MTTPEISEILEQWITELLKDTKARAMMVRPCAPATTPSVIILSLPEYELVKRLEEMNPSWVGAHFGTDNDVQLLPDRSELGFNKHIRARLLIHEYNSTDAWTVDGKTHTICYFDDGTHSRRHNINFYNPDDLEREEKNIQEFRIPKNTGATMTIALGILCAVFFVLWIIAAAKCKIYEASIKVHKLAHRYTQKYNSVWIDATTKLLKKLKALGHLDTVSEVMDEIRDKFTSVSMEDDKDEVKDKLGDVTIPDFLPEDF
jgi:hypothetical protein